jgi:transposase InsO family protein
MSLVSINHENIKEISVNMVTTPSKESLFTAFPQVFDGSLGTLPGVQHLERDLSVKPSIDQVRRVPPALMKDLKAELHRLEGDGVIAQVTEPTDWVSSLVTPEKKNGKLRVCIDPRRLNAALRRERYLMPTIDDVLPELQNAKVFTVADLKSGYWHVSLDDESSYLTTFNTPYGRFRWLRLPFGLSVSSEIFQRRLHQALDGLDGVMCVADDIIVIGSGTDHGTATAQHDERLQLLLERCKELGIKLNKEKLQLRTNCVKFLGHIISDKGLQADPEKVQCIQQMAAPTDPSEVRRFLGMIQYLARFMPDLATVSEPLRSLTKKDSEFLWGPEQEVAFSHIKKLITREPVLRFYDGGKDLEIQCDASDKGLGATLMQEGQPLEYGSRSLTETESRYAPIEKEMLAIVWAVERYHQYTYGNFTTVYSDHKPLERIMMKPLKEVPKRLQNMILRLQHYNIKVEHRPGTQQLIADELSRTLLTPLNQPDGDATESVLQIIADDEWRNKLILATQRDRDLQTLSMVIKSGWPGHKNDLPDPAKPYFNFRDEMALYDGIVYRGERVVIPKSLRREMMKEAHSSHMGQQNTLRRARECMYWPQMAAEISEHVASCEACQTYGASQQRESLMPLELADRPWQMISSDICTLDGSDYLVTVDHFSNFIELDRLRDTGAKEVIKRLKKLMSRYGIPEIFISDCGSQFLCDQFRRFATAWGFTHRTSSPHHQQANGRAEAAVKTVKASLRKAKKAGDDPYKALLACRNTEQEGIGSSPSQRFLGRRARTSLPTTAALLKPSAYHLENNHMQWKKQQVDKNKYDRHAKDLEPLTEGSQVRMKPVALGDKVWIKANVLKRLDERSYLVRDGMKVLRRNRKDLKAIPSSNGAEESSQPESEQPNTADPVCCQPNVPDINPRENPTAEPSNSTNDEPPRVSRYGRQIRLPSKLRDYVLN